MSTLRDRVVPALTEWVAAQNSFYTQPATLDRAILADGLCRVLGTAGRKPAMLSEPRTQNQLIGANDGQKYLFHGQ